MKRRAGWIGLLALVLTFGCGGEPNDEEPKETSADVTTADTGGWTDTGVDPDTGRADTGGGTDTGVDPDTGRADTGGDLDTGSSDTAADTAPAGEVCDDGVDNDDNGQVDCRDAVCGDFPRCTFTGMASGRSHACGVVDSGEVVCWGRNKEGQLGNGETTETPPGPVFVDGIETAVDVTVGLAHSCARLADGGLRCWGNNEYGQLGDDSFVNSPFPVKVAGVTEARDVGAGGHHTCAVVNEAGNLWCWGNNESHQAGESSGERRRTPGPLASLGSDHTGFQSVSAGIEHTCGLVLVDKESSPDQQLRLAMCWGANDVGQLGMNRDDVDKFALAYTVKANDRSMVDLVPGSLAAGQNSTCVIREGGSVWCWGDGTNGPFGSEELSTDFQYQAVEVPGLGDARRLWHELFHVCAERESGRVVCWGDNANHAFAGTPDMHLDPVLFGNLQRPRDVAPGDMFTCWATAEGRGFCQGVGDQGQLGVAIDSYSTGIPQRVVPVFSVK